MILKSDEYLDPKVDTGFSASRAGAGLAILNGSVGEMQQRALASHDPGLRIHDSVVQGRRRRPTTAGVSGLGGGTRGGERAAVDAYRIRSAG